MPYIKKERRKALWNMSNIDQDDSMQSSGELNFRITELIIDYLKLHKLSYQTCNDIVGALDSAKEEFRRRVVNPYEDKKRKENGDVYKFKR